MRSRQLSFYSLDWSKLETLSQIGYHEPLLCESEGTGEGSNGVAACWIKYSDLGVHLLEGVHS